MKMNVKTLKLIKELTGYPVVDVAGRLMVGRDEITPVELLAEYSSKTIDIAELPAMGFAEEGEFTVPVLVFISRHKPTPEQFGLARDAGLLLVTCEDMDPFDSCFLKKLNDLTIPCHYAAIATSNAATAALAISAGYDVGVFQAVERPKVDEARQSYEPYALHVYEGIVNTPKHIMDLLKEDPA